MNPAADDPVTLIGYTNFRGKRQPFGIRRSDRFSHFYAIGKSGTGKTTLLSTMIRQDIAAGHGVAVLDPHGDLVRSLIAAIPSHRQSDVIHLDAPEPTNPITYNPLQGAPPGRQSLTAAYLVEVFKKLWPDSWGPRVEHLWRNALLVLLDQPQATLEDVPRLLIDDAFRRQAAARSANPIVRDFWLREFAAYPARFRAEVVAPLQNKVGAFLSIPRLRSILVTPNGNLNLQNVLDDGRILLINLSKGLIGEDAASLLGALLLAGIGLAGLSRADRPEKDRRDFFVFLDEFQSYATLSLAGMLAELRKYRVSLTLANQYFGQIDSRIRESIIGNVGSIACLRIGAAEALQQEFDPPFRVKDLVSLPNLHMYVKLMVDGTVSKPFSAQILRPSQLDEL